jgi:hypothetical protein
MGPEDLQRILKQQQHNAGYGEQLKSAEIKKSGIESALDELRGRLESVESAAGRLLSRLGPVSAQQPLAEKASGQTAPTALCEVEDRIMAATRRIEVLAQILNDARDQLRI